MKIIQNIDELKLLNSKEIFYVAHKGYLSQYYFCCIHPLHNNLIVAICGARHTDLKSFGRFAFNSETTFIVGKYNSKEVGKILKNQLESAIQDIKQVYLSESTNHE